ncbi:prealbumin-like fold domain-containing protein [uncultured Anaerococcus sp.]|uniref:prealbumin-like fold domain-containing protein n=1 Tax=uncultured Anaerococcus sp. TaxID=293428 RepID=UPI00260BE4A9|nr:prealbumin-like fold domain-containing protein [uncultured Anaerococcus sp.]
MYVGDPTASCTVDKNTMKQIYPNRQVSSPQIQINGRAINLKDPNSKTKSRSQVLEKYEITFKSPDLRNRTLLIRMKARKIAERNLSNYINYRYNGNKYSYNRVEVVATNGRKYGYQNAYATAPADAGGIISPGTGERGNFRFRKVYKANNVTKPISNNPAIFEIKDSNDKSLGKVKTDKDGYAFFDNLEKGKTYYIKEISPPKGYIQDYTNYKVTVSKTNVNDIRMTVAGKDVSISYDKPYDFVNQRLYPLRIKKLDNNSKKA